MSDTRKKRRRTYLESFRRDKDGKYVYQGETYTCRESGQMDWKRLLFRLWAFGIGLLVCQVAAGCITAPGMDHCFYVLLPYAAGLIAGISACWALGRLTAGGNPLKAYIYEASVKVLPARAILTALAAGICIAGEVVFVCGNGMEGKSVSFFVFLILQMLEVALALLLRREILLTEWVK